MVLMKFMGVVSTKLEMWTTMMLLLAKRLILHGPDDSNNPTMIPTTIMWSWQKCFKGEAGWVIRHEQKGEKPWSAGTRRTEENRGELKFTPAARELHTKMCLGTLCTTLYTLKVAYSSVACDGWSRPGIRDLRPFVPSCSVYSLPPSPKFELGLFFCVTRYQAMHT